MFRKILIANRGEIACRVIKTARRLGIATVAVYSDADANALHVKMAAEAIHIGPPPANQSYIVIDKIMQAIRDSGADAVHPGYGFLSENARFAEILQEHDIAFIGPSAEHISIMGDKIEAKTTAKRLRIPVVPGSDGGVSGIDAARRVARDVGYPVLIKAASGGGGRACVAPSTSRAPRVR